MAFAGLSDGLFATYDQAKWSSMVHNLARMKAKETLLALCTDAAFTSTEALEGLARAASDEIPNITNHKRVDAQWVYWFRGPEERQSLASFLQSTPLNEATIFDIAAQDKHAILAVIARETGLWIGLRIAPGAVVDRRNLASKLAKSWERERLLEMLRALPEGAEVGTDGHRVSTAEVDLAHLAGDAERLSEEGVAWSLGHSIPAAGAVALGAGVAAEVGRWLHALAPLYRFVAWSRANDSIDVNKQIKHEKEQKRRQAHSYREGDKVRIISGMFTGKLGVVETIDTKAKVKVRVGTMIIVVSGHDLVRA
jgi:hypothetical protein